MKTYLIILSSFLLISCNTKLFGTNTGNPDLTAPAEEPAPSDENLIKSGIYAQIDQICIKLNSCFTQVATQTCYNQILELIGYTSELGAIANQYSTVTDLRTAEKNKEVSINSSNFTTCYHAIGNLICTDFLIQDNFSITEPFDFSSTNKFFRASSACSEIY